MKIAAVQLQSKAGDINENIKQHLLWIQRAIEVTVDLIVFPELSITGYEPGLAESLATNLNDERFKEFRRLSDDSSISIAVGLPTKSSIGTHISMAVFQAKDNARLYSKQMLHPDEKPYFTEGESQLVFTVKNKRIAPAICFESLQHEHAESAAEMDVDLYLASVAKPQKGIEIAYKHYPEIARKYNMSVVMSNSLGYSDNFRSAGQTAFWDEEGNLIDQLGIEEEGMLVCEI